MKNLLLLFVLFFFSGVLFGQNNVGIGIPDPQEKLHIKGGDLKIEDAFPRIILSKNGGVHSQFEHNSINTILSNYDGGKVLFNTGGSPKMTITAPGNVGIGITDPQALLHVNNGNIRLQGDNKFIDFYTQTPNVIGMRFHRDALFEGGMVYDSGRDMLRVAHNFNFAGMHYDLQNVRLGVNVMEPEETLHIKDGGIRHESANEFINIVSTDSLLLNGIRYFQRNNFIGAQFVNTLTKRYNLSGSALNSGMVFDFNNNNLGLKTDTPLDALHVAGEVRLEHPSLRRIKFFEGTQMVGYLQHYVGHMYLTNSQPGFLYLRTNGASRISIDGTGLVGIGTTTPDTRVDILGTNGWNLATTEGDFRLGNESYRIKMGVALDGAGAGTGRIYGSGGTNRLILGAGTQDVMAIDGAGRVGIGNFAPSYNVDVLGDEARALNIINSYSGTSSKYGIYIEADALGSGTKYGINSLAYGTASDASSVYGVRAYSSGNGNTGNAYGLYAQVSATGTGNHYGVYTTANTTNPSAGSRSWALYAQGHSYFSHDVRIGTLDGATGYVLSVDGKIIGEEVKVQLDQNWPDYVFDSDYQLPSLKEVKQHINEKGHLPGVPSAAEVDENNGFHLGEMNRVLLEKVEELTLYILQQEERIEELERIVTGKN